MPLKGRNDATFKGISFSKFGNVLAVVAYLKSNYFFGLVVAFCLSSDHV